MLSIGLKHCVEKTDLVKPVSRYIGATYKGDDSKQAQQHAMTKHRDRVDLVTNLKTIATNKKAKADAFRSLIGKHYEYFAYLKSVQQRFRVANAKAGWSFSLNPFATKIIHLSFTWSDSFNRHLRFTSHDLEHEKASILLNIAALESLEGVRSDREDQQDIKKALHCFQNAAGTLEYITSTQLRRIHTPKSGDLMPKLLLMLKETMQGQAQECVLEACLLKKVKPSLLASVAQAASIQYRKAIGYCEGYQPGEWLRRCAYPWRMHLQFKERTLRARAIFYLSRSLMDDEKWGHELAALAKALKTAKRAKQILADMKGSGLFNQKIQFAVFDRMAAEIDAIEKGILKRHKTALRENEAIYHHRIAKESQLPDIEAKLIAQPSAFAEPPAESKSPYNNLIPAKIQETAAAFRQEMKDLFATKRESSEEKAEQIRQSLQSLNLPAALDAREGLEGIPDPLWARIETLQTKGGMEHVDGLLKQVLSSQDKAWEIFNSTKSALEVEQSDDAKLRVDFGGSWTRAPSRELTVEFQNQLTTVEGYLKRAAHADEKLTTKRKKQGGCMELVVGSRSEIEASVPKLSSKDQQPTQQTPETPEEKALKGNLDKLNKVIEARAKIISLAESKFFEIEIDAEILNDQAKKISIEETKTRLRSTIDLYTTKLDKIDTLQKDLLQQTQQNNDAWKDRLKASPSMAARSKFFGDLNAGVEAFETLTNNLMQGLKFYGDCMATYLNPLTSQVNDFIVAREHEKKMYMDQITRALAAAGGHTHTKHDTTLNTLTTHHTNHTHTKHTSHIVSSAQ